MSVYASYALIDATFRDALELTLPPIPAAHVDGVVHVRRGDRIPTIPRHPVQTGFDAGFTAHSRYGPARVAAVTQAFRRLVGHAV